MRNSPGLISVLLSLLIFSVNAFADSFMPPAVSAIAREYDKIYGFLLISSFISFVIVVVGMIYFVFKYKRKSQKDKTAYITHNHMLEFLWSFIPFLIFMFVFVWGWWLYRDMRTVPENALEIHVVAKKWNWTFIYKNGRTMLPDVDADGRPNTTMVVPVNRPVKLIMTSLGTTANAVSFLETNRTGDLVPVPKADDAAPAKGPKTVKFEDLAVIHDFFVPAFRVKQDVVPGRYTQMWFEADKLGEYQVFCAEYCGDNHSLMTAKIKVVSQSEFDEWLSGEKGGGAGGGGTPADKGKQLYQAMACIGCHSTTGAASSGPTFKGVFGRTEALEGGSSAKVDENYIRESILNPNAKVVKGFNPVMPTFAGQLTDEDITNIIEFIKTVK